MLDGPDPAISRAQARVGRVLKDKWRLDRLLGLGGMASVYAATHRNGKRVAVKMLHVELSVDPGIRSRFLREGYVANKVEHSGAVSVIDDDTAEDGAVYLVMELLEGETLQDRARRCGGRLEAGEVLALADQLLDVLGAAHDKGILHRDIKPENVFVARDGQVKILDFGIARLKELSTASTATRSGATMGTPAFMPPEQARGRWEEVDARSDLWAVGATMYALLTGRNVHEARTVNELLLAAMTSKAPPVATVIGGLPPMVADLVDKALAFERSDRWPDARTMQGALRAAYHACQGRPISTAPRLGVPQVVIAAASSETPADSAATQAMEPTGGRFRRLPVVVSIVTGLVVLSVGMLFAGRARIQSTRAEVPSSSAVPAPEVRTVASGAVSAPPEPSAIPIDQLPSAQPVASRTRLQPAAARRADAGAQPPGTSTSTSPPEPDMDKRR